MVSLYVCDLYNVGTGYKPITVLADTCAAYCFAPDKRFFPVFDMEVNFNFT